MRGGICVMNKIKNGNSSLSVIIRIGADHCFICAFFCAVRIYLSVLISEKNKELEHSEFPGKQNMPV